MIEYNIIFKNNKKTMWKISLDILEKTVKEIGKQSGSQFFITGKDTGTSVEKVSSWSTKFDSILWGGLPKWRIIEMFWSESSWKTSMALIMAAEATRRGEHVLYIDAEQALDLEYGHKLGINFYRPEDFAKEVAKENQKGLFVLVQPDYGEQAFTIVSWAIQSCAFGLIIVDSVPALTPKAILEGNSEDPAQIWLLARLLSRELSKVNSLLWQTKDTVLVFINQERDKIGGFMPSFWEAKTTPGWRSLKFYSSIRIEVSKWAPISRWDDRIWTTIRLKAVKNKLTAPYKKTDVTLMFDEELKNYWIDANQEIVDDILNNDLYGTRWRFLSLTGKKIKSEEGFDWKTNLARYLKNRLTELEYMKNLIINSEDINILRNDITTNRDQNGVYIPYKEYLASIWTSIEEIESTIVEKTSTTNIGENPSDFNFNIELDNNEEEAI